MNKPTRLLAIVSGIALLATIAHVPPATYGQGTPAQTVYLPFVSTPVPCLEIAAALMEDVDPHCPPRGSSSGVARGDFNNDGFADLAIGVPGEDLTVTGGFKASDAGAVNVIYGSAHGLSATAGPGNQLWTQGSAGVNDDPEPQDFFGTALASGDFNGDHYSDLAIGVPGEDLGPLADAGAVNVLYGGPHGLTAANNQVWTQGISNAGRLQETPESGDEFGAALAWGNFDGDVYGDLLVGVSLEDLTVNGTSQINAGGINVVYGSPSGLSGTAGPGNQFWSQNSPGIEGAAERRDDFGAALTAGDMNGDGFQDVAIGVLYEDITISGHTISNAGAVNVIYGSAAGLSATAGPGDQIWDQTTVPGTPVENDRFGAAVVAGDFNGDDIADLAIGAPLDDVNNRPDAGNVTVLYGGIHGLSTRGTQLLSQDATGPNLDVADQSKSGDHFGMALAAGDINGDGIRDLAIGVPGEDYESTGLPSRPDVGGVNILYGSLQGLRGRAPYLYVIGSWQAGLALSMWNFNGDRMADLAIADLYDGGGRVRVLYGPLHDSVSSSDYQVWRQDSSGIQGETEDDDGFGSAIY